MTNVTVCNSRQTRKRGWSQVHAHPKKRKERPGRVEEELHVHGIAAFPFSKRFSCSSVLILRTSGTQLCSLRGRNHTVPTAQPSPGLISIARKLFLMIFYLINICMFLRYQAEFQFLDSDPLPKHAFSWDQVPVTLSLVLSSHICHNWVRCWAEGGDYSQEYSSL